MSDTKNQVIEFASFTLAEGVDESALLLASDALQAEFLSRQQGFIRRELVKAGAGRWADLLYWDSQESVERAMQEAPNNPAALKYFQLMANTGQTEPAAAMMLMTVAKSYP